MQPDPLDAQIIDLLRDGQTSNSTIARELNVSEGTIRQRLRRLREAGIITVRGLIDPDVLENQQLALIAMKVADSQKLDEKAREVAELENVTSVMLVSGRYDIMAEVLVDSNRGLVHFLTETLPQVEGVSGSETFVVLKSHKKWV